MSDIILRHGNEDDSQHGVVHTTGVERKSRTLLTYPGETLGGLTMRAYGANSAENRAKIIGANTTLTGTVIIPS